MGTDRKWWTKARGVPIVSRISCFDKKVDVLKNAIDEEHKKPNSSK
jgi:hypothetical protein